MDANFWHQRWGKNEIGWHETKVNPLLVQHFNELGLEKGSRIFIPLCGKTLDISWLHAQGYRIAGAELSKVAIEHLFTELGVQPNISARGEGEQWSANHIDIFVGDIFALSTETLGHVDRIYDRAAFVAFPEDMRNRYARHLIEITEKAPQLLICYDYDQRRIEGPPFSIPDQEVKRQYASAYQVRLLSSTEVPGGLKGKCPAKEKAWLLSN
jgi:thiopurine S-methyltransferase